MAIGITREKLSSFEFHRQKIDNKAVRLIFRATVYPEKKIFHLVLCLFFFLLSMRKKIVIRRHQRDVN